MDDQTTPELLEKLPLVDIFDCLSDTVFFVKDLAGRYVLVNDTLVIRCGRKNKAELIGKTPSAIMGAKLGKSYESQDQLVLQSSRPITQQLELHMYRNRTIGWCITNKRVILSKHNEVIGITGVSQDLRPPNMAHTDFMQIKPVIEYVTQNLDLDLSIKYLATLGRISPYQLDRRIQAIFGLTTGQWILKNRLDLARRQLMHNDVPISEVALCAGYADQSTFARQFKKTTGLTPSNFRSMRSQK